MMQTKHHSSKKTVENDSLIFYSPLFYSFFSTIVVCLIVFFYYASFKRRVLISNARKSRDFFFCLLVNACDEGTRQNIVEQMQQNLIPQPPPDLFPFNAASMLHSSSSRMESLHLWVSAVLYSWQASLNHPCPPSRSNDRRSVHLLFLTWTDFETDKHL